MTAAIFGFLLGIYGAGVLLCIAERPLHQRLWRYGFEAGRRDAQARYEAGCETYRS